MAKPPIGVLVMAYGTPKNLDEVEAYYTDIRHGRAPTPELLADLKSRYGAIGGLSPLNEITQAQCTGLEKWLNQHSAIPQFKVYLGLKHVVPSIQDAVADMVKDGVEEAVGIVLAPHYSRLSIGTYESAARSAIEKLHGPQFYMIPSWHLQPRFLALLADRVTDSLQKFALQDSVKVLFTAHSLPERILADHDPYPQQLRETGEAVAAKLGLKDYDFGWQSAGRTQETWLGPDILIRLAELADSGVKQVLVCPAGFVSDHLEVLYDLDVQASTLATELGIHFERTRSLNADEAFLRALSEVVMGQIETVRRNVK